MSFLEEYNIANHYFKIDIKFYTNLFSFKVIYETGIYDCNISNKTEDFKEYIVFESKSFGTK